MTWEPDPQDPPIVPFESLSEEDYFVMFEYEDTRVINRLNDPTAQARGVDWWDARCCEGQVRDASGAWHTEQDSEQMALWNAIFQIAWEPHWLRKGLGEDAYDPKVDKKWHLWGAWHDESKTQRIAFYDGVIVPQQKNAAGEWEVDRNDWVFVQAVCDYEDRIDKLTARVAELTEQRGTIAAERDTLAERVSVLESLQPLGQDNQTDAQQDAEDEQAEEEDEHVVDYDPNCLRCRDFEEALKRVRAENERLGKMIAEDTQLRTRGYAIVPKVKPVTTAQYLERARVLREFGDWDGHEVCVELARVRAGL